MADPFLFDLPGHELLNKGMRFDLHVHSTASPCSSLTLEQILGAAEDKNLDGVCITDHDTMAVAQLINEGVQKNGLVVIVGMEYTTANGDFLLLGPFTELPPGLSAPRLLELVYRVNGIAIAAHPFRHGRSTDEQLMHGGLCPIIEGVNGRNEGPENLRAELFARQFGLKIIGGSDAHGIDELGLVTTKVHRPINDRNDLINALRTGAFSLDDDRNWSSVQSEQIAPYSWANG